MRKDWEVKKLGDIATYINGYAFKPNQWSDTGIPIIRIQNLNDDDAKYNYCDNDNIPSKYLVNKGDVLISWSASLGVYEWLKNTAYLNQHIFKVVFDKLEISKYYFKYAVSSKIDHMVRNAHGATMKHIVKKDFDNTKIYYPPLQTQQEIVEELDCLTSIIEKQKKQLEELDNLAQSIFYDMFGDPIVNEKGWNVKKLGDLCISDLGKTLNKSKDTGNSLPYLCSINIQWNYIDLSVKKEALFEENEINKYSVLKGDLLVCEGGDIGRAAIWKEDYSMLYQNALHRIRFDKNIIAKYVLYFLWRLKQKGILDTRYAKGVTIKHLVKSSLLSINIPVPPLPLQEEFASKIEAIEKQKELIKKSIKETEDLFNSRMDYYFN